MPKLPAIRPREFFKIVKKAGFTHEATRGSHFIFRRHTDGKMLSIPAHKGRDLGKGIALAIIKDMGLTPEEFIKQLKS